jgi:hypothetical protein
VDASGNAYVTGVTAATNFPTVNAFQPTINGPDPDTSFCFYGTEAFVAKLSASGSSLLYSTYLGGIKYDGGNAIAVDDAGNAYVTGSTGSRNFPTRNALFPALHGSRVVAGITRKFALLGEDF